MTSAVKIFTLNTVRRAMSSCSGGEEEDEEDEEERCPSFPPSFLSDVFPLPQSSFPFFDAIKWVSGTHRHNTPEGREGREKDRWWRWEEALQRENSRER